MIVSRNLSITLGIVSIAMAAATLATPVFADSADDLVSVLEYGKYYTSLSQLMVGQAVQKLQSLNVSAPDLQADRAKIEGDAGGYRVVFLHQIADSYRAHFSQAELDQLLIFYRSPLGQKVSAMQGPIKDDLALASRNAGMYIGVQAAQLVK